MYIIVTRRIPTLISLNGNLNFINFFNEKNPLRVESFAGRHL
jgi:hypothetical protein